MWLLIPGPGGHSVVRSALAVFLSAVNVYLRDTQHLVEVVLMAWFWAVPGIYRFTGCTTCIVKHSSSASPGPPDLAVLR